MALIRCPECGKEISNKAEACPNCGYPIASLGKAKRIINEEYAVILENAGVNKVKAIRDVREVTGLGLKEAKEMTENVPCVVIDKISLEAATAIRNAFEEDGAIVSVVSSDDKSTKITVAKEANKIRCPRCGSTQITTGQRGFSFWTGFIGANKTVTGSVTCIKGDRK